MSARRWRLVGGRGAVGPDHRTCPALAGSEPARRESGRPRVTDARQRGEDPAMVRAYAGLSEQIQHCSYCSNHHAPLRLCQSVPLINLMLNRAADFEPPKAFPPFRSDQTTGVLCLTVDCQCDQVVKVDKADRIVPPSINGIPAPCWTSAIALVHLFLLLVRPKLKATRSD